MSICGLDFGTSNTTLGTIEDHLPVLAALENGQTTIPSSIFFETNGAVLIGRQAVEAYVDGSPGRLMRSLKSVLGTALIDETTRLGGDRTSFRSVIAYYLGAVKRRAEVSTGSELRQVVHGRPVHFVDNARTLTAKPSKHFARSRAISASMISPSSLNRSPLHWTTSARFRQRKSP